MVDNLLQVVCDTSWETLEKVKQHIYREELEKQHCIDWEKTYVAPTHVQFDVLEYNDLNKQNKEKVAVLERKRYGRMLLLSEIRKHDTSILDELLRILK